MLCNRVMPSGATSSLVSVHKRAYFTAFTMSCALAEGALTGADGSKSAVCRQNSVTGACGGGRHGSARGNCDAGSVQVGLRRVKMTRL